jgi:ABC-type polysaccharide/polyol phosphate export permease
MHGERTKLLPLLRGLWRTRTLIRTLARKDFHVRYRRSSIGLLWAIGLPLIQAVVLAIIFSRIARFGTPVRYPIYVLSGTLPWTFFSGAFQSATTSIVDGSSLATKVYFPRAAFPLMTVASTFHGYLPGVAVMIGLAAALRVHLGVALLYLIPSTILMVLLTAAFSLCFASLHVYFRDMKYVVAASIFPWYWATGVIFPLNRLGGLKKWLELNPTVGMVQLNRAALGAAYHGWERSVVITLIWVAALLAIAIPLYQRYDRVYVDLL